MDWMRISGGGSDCIFVKVCILSLWGRNNSVCRQILNLNHTIAFYRGMTKAVILT